MELETAKPYRDVWLNAQKSAEVIVSVKKCGGEGLNDKRFSKFEGRGEI